jgi:hypothetical protein
MSMTVIVGAAGLPIPRQDLVSTIDNEKKAGNGVFMPSWLPGPGRSLRKKYISGYSNLNTLFQ